MKIKSYVSNFVQKISSSDGTFTQALNLAETHNVGFVNISFIRNEVNFGKPKFQKPYF